MAVINVPKPPKSAFDKNRKLSTLLAWQLEHFQEAEFRLPVDHTTDVYVNAIKTEGDAADYIRQVTKKVHELHGVPIAKPKKKARPGRGLTLAAAAKPSKKKSKTTRKSTSRKTQS
jgi:hypothetical protein